MRIGEFRIRRRSWTIPGAPAAFLRQGASACQSPAVLKVCRERSSLSAAGRELFAQSRKLKTSGNDADRLRKYLMRFGLSFEAVAPRR